MSLSAATLIPGLAMLVLGLLFLINNSATVSLIRSFPRSGTGAVIFFGGGAALFLWVLRGLSEADLVLVENPTYLMVFFGVLAVSAFFYIPDFLAVRGVSILTLLVAWPLLMTAYGEYDKPQRLVMVAPMLLVILPAALYAGAAPYRARDFLEWLYRAPRRAQLFGGLLLAYGIALAATAFTY